MALERGEQRLQFARTSPARRNAVPARATQPVQAALRAARSTPRRGDPASIGRIALEQRLGGERARASRSHPRAARSTQPTTPRTKTATRSRDIQQEMRLGERRRRLHEHRRTDDSRARKQPARDPRVRNRGRSAAAPARAAASRSRRARGARHDGARRRECTIPPAAAARLGAIERPIGKRLPERRAASARAASCEILVEFGDSCAHRRTTLTTAGCARGNCSAAARSGTPNRRRRASIAATLSDDARRGAGA